MTRQTNMIQRMARREPSRLYGRRLPPAAGRTDDTDPHGSPELSSMAGRAGHLRCHPPSSVESGLGLESRDADKRTPRKTTPAPGPGDGGGSGRPCVRPGPDRQRRRDRLAAAVRRHLPRRLAADEVRPRRRRQRPGRAHRPRAWRSADGRDVVGRSTADEPLRAQPAGDAHRGQRLFRRHHVSGRRRVLLPDPRRLGRHDGRPVEPQRPRRVRERHVAVDRVRVRALVRRAHPRHAGKDSRPGWTIDRSSARPLPA